MLICWPGILSSVKRAATSDTRWAPLVTTTYLHHDQDQEHDQADHVVATHHERTDGTDHAARIPVGQDQARGRHVERQPEQRGDQQ